MKAIILEPGKAPYLKNIKGDLDELTSIVDGCIESMSLGCSAVALFDEDGIMKCKQPGHSIMDAHMTPHHIVGTAVLLGVSGSDFCDVPDSLIRSYNLD